MLLLALVLASCSNELSEAGSSANDRNIAYRRLFVQDDIARWTSFMAWGDGGDCVTSFSEEQNALIVTASHDWINGAVFSSNEQGRYFDFEKVEYIRFDIQGNIPLERAVVHVYGFNQTYGEEQFLSECVDDLEAYERGEKVTATVDLALVSDYARNSIERPFVFRVLGTASPDCEDPRPLEPGQYVEISSIDFLDYDHKHIDIAFEPQSFTAGSYANLFADPLDDDLSLRIAGPQVWDNTCILQFRDTGMRVYATNSTWFGCSITMQNGYYADFSDIAAISFDIKGNMKPDEVLVGYQATSIYSDGTVLSELDDSMSFNEDVPGHYILPLPDDLKPYQRKLGSALFYLSQGNGYAGPESWIELSNVRYLDKEGQPVMLSLTELAEADGTYDDLFSQSAGVNGLSPSLDMQVWSNDGGNAIPILTKEGLMVIPSGSWATVVMVNREANIGETFYKQFDFSGIKAMRFSIKGVIDTDSIQIAVIGDEATTPSGALSGFIREIYEDRFSTVTVDLPDVDYPVRNPLAISTVNVDGDGSGWMGGYVIITDVEYLDGEGNPVPLSYIPLS